MPDFLGGVRRFASTRPVLLAWILIALWVGGHLIVKAWTRPGLDLDSAEQVYMAQSWQLGYGTRQPPLYTWLLLSIRSWNFASWPATLEAARYALLALWLSGVWFVARVGGARAPLQALSVLAHLGLALVIWRVHDSLTHTVLAGTLATWGSGATLRAWVRPKQGMALAPAPDRRWLVLAGVLAGLACLSKFNAAIWWGTLAMGLCCAPGLRGRMRPADWAAWLAPSALLVLPYALGWAFERMQVGQTGSRLLGSEPDRAVWRVLVEYGISMAAFLFPMPLLIGLVGWKVRLRQAASSKAASLPWWLGWVAWQSFWALALTAVLVVFFHPGDFKARWLWPVAPLLSWLWLAWAWAQIEGAQDGRARRRVFGIAGLGVVVAFVAIGLRGWEPTVNAQRCRQCWTDRPAATVVEALNRRHGPSLRVITGDVHLAGTLLAASPGLPIWAITEPQMPASPGFHESRATCVVAWGAMEPPEGVARPAIVEAWLKDRSDVDLLPLRRAPSRRFRLESRALPASACDQRQAPRP